MTKKQLPYPEWKAANKIILAEIQPRYPLVFNSDKPLPLKIGIHKDMFQVCPEISKVKIKGFLRWWVRRNKYKAVKVLAEANKMPRYDLWGNECDPGPIKTSAAEKGVAPSPAAK